MWRGVRKGPGIRIKGYRVFAFLSWFQVEILLGTAPAPGCRYEPTKTDEMIDAVFIPQLEVQVVGTVYSHIHMGDRRSLPITVLR
jgi:hypothetical protein